MGNAEVLMVIMTWHIGMQMKADCWLLGEYQAVATFYDKFVPVVTAYVMNWIILTFLCIYFEIVFIFSI